MSPEVKLALEDLVGRTLTAEEVTAIDAHIPARNDVAIAAVLSTGRTRVSLLPKTTFQRWAAKTGVRSVIEDQATDAGSPLRAIALTLRDIFWSSTSNAIDFSEPDNQLMLQAWVTAAAITQAQADELIAFATIPNPISVGDVSDALNRAEGRLTMQFTQGDLE